MADRRNLTKLSKFLTLMLRHQSEAFGLQMDKDGFAEVDAIWARVNERFPGRFNYKDLLTVIEGDQHGKKRLELRDGRIRALYGHSTVVPIAYSPIEPPEILYHGTTQEALTAIRRDGLKAMGRQYVHMTPREDMARRVAGRHSRHTVILHIRAKDASLAGIAFFNPEQDNFLAKAVPAQFIDFDSED